MRRFMVFSQATNQAHTPAVCDDTNLCHLDAECPLNVLDIVQDAFPHLVVSTGDFEDNSVGPTILRHNRTTKDACRNHWHSHDSATASSVELNYRHSSWVPDPHSAPRHTTLIFPCSAGVTVF